MAGGAFQTSREIFENPIWQDVIKFRLFFFIVGNAIFAEEGARSGGVHLKRGQYLRSYRNLSSDLEYLDNRSLKKYSISVIKKKVDQLVKENRVEIEETELGTLFTVVNCDMYQGFDHYKGGNREQRENSARTERERSENNNNNGNKVKKVKNDIKDYTAEIKEFLVRYQSIEDFNKLNKDYWDVIRETRTNGKVAQSVIHGSMSKWVKYDPVVVQYSLKSHIEAYAGRKENYTIGIMRGTTKDEAEDKLNTKPATKQPVRKGAADLDKVRELLGNG